MDRQDSDESLAGRQLKALNELIPWDEKEHPELSEGAAEWVRKLRRETEQRFKRETTG